MQHIWAIFNNNTHIPVHLPKFDEKENNQDMLELRESIASW